MFSGSVIPQLFPTLGIFTIKTVSAKLRKAKARKVSTSNSDDRARAVETLYLDLVIIKVLCVFPFCPFLLIDLPQLFHLHVCNSILNNLKVALCPCITRKGFPGSSSGKEPACQCRRLERRGFNPWVRKIPWRRKWQPAPVFLPGKSHGQRSLAGYSTWGCKESDTTEHTHTHIIRKDWLHVGYVFFTLTFAFHWLCLLKGYCPYIMGCLREPNLSA